MWLIVAYTWWSAHRCIIVEWETCGLELLTPDDLHTGVSLFGGGGGGEGM